MVEANPEIEDSMPMVEAEPEEEKKGGVATSKGKKKKGNKAATRFDINL